MTSGPIMLNDHISGLMTGDWAASLRVEHPHPQIKSDPQG